EIYDGQSVKTVATDIQIVLNPRFTISAPLSLIMLDRGVVTLNVDAIALDGYTGTHTPSCPGQNVFPLDGITCVFDPPSFVGGSGTSVLTVSSNMSGIGIGDRPMTISSTDGSLTSNATVNLIVQQFGYSSV